MNKGSTGYPPRIDPLFGAWPIAPPVIASQTFSYAAAAQTFTVPATVTKLDVIVKGAQGGKGEWGAGNDGIGGAGAIISGRLTVTPGEVLQINVGGKPLTEYNAVFGGGGNAAAQDASTHGGAGGGASDIRRGAYALADRLIVAGGGGGGANRTTGPGGISGINGAQGTPVAGSGGEQFIGGGGSATAGGVAGQNGSAGTLGLGGNAATGGGNLRPGAGGGGLYGGGGGGTNIATDEGSGGGGSSLGGMFTGVNSGNGSIIISWEGVFVGTSDPIATITDSFTRADSGSSLGTSTSGHTWSVDAGTWGITGNKGYHSDASSESHATINGPSGDGWVAADIRVSPSPTNRVDCGLVARYSDTNNLILAAITKDGTLNGFRLLKRVTGTWTQLGTTLAAVNEGQTYALRLVFNGTNIRVIVDGNTFINVTDSNPLQTNTRRGMRINFGASSDSNSSFFDNFESA